MDDITRSPTMDRLEHALAAAARHFVDESRRQAIDLRSRHELQALCARLGLSPADCAAVAAGTAAPGLRANAQARLLRDAERLARAARGRRIGYDLNRHIAVHRALLQLAATPAPAAARPDPRREDRLSGSALNARFRKPGPRRAARRQHAGG